MDLTLQNESPRARVPPRVLAALGAGTLLFLVGDVGLRQHQTLVHAWANLGWTLVSFLAAWKCLRTARRTPHRSRARAWRWFGAGCTLWFVGMLAWSYFELALEEFTPFPAISELGFQGMVLPFVMGFYEYGRDERDTAIGLKLVGDYGVMFASMIMSTAILYYVPARADVSVWYVVCALGYPVLHFSALSFALVTYWQREWRENGRVLGWLIAATAVHTLVTTLYAHSLLTHSYEAGHDLDVLWVVGFAFVIAAAHLEDELPAGATPPRLREGSVWDALVPSAMLGVVVVITYVYRAQWSPELVPVFLGGGLLLVASLAVRTLGYQAYERDLREKSRGQERELMQAQKMQALGTLAGGIAHDFNNLLSGMLGGVGLLRRMPELGPRGQSYVDLMEQSMLRAAELAKRLRALSRAPSGARVAFRPRDLASRVAVLIERGASGARDVRIELDEDALGYFLGDVGVLEQGLLNLALNAQHATTTDGVITIGVALRHESGGTGRVAGDYLVLFVRDDGCGIPEEMHTRVFEPFFTTRSPEEGTGLGLAMVHAAAADHGGFVHLESAPGEGTLVEMWVPAEPASESMVPVEEQRAALPVGRGRVLVVDDRDGPLLAAKAVLEACGYDVELAWSGRAALSIVARESVDLVLTDAVMPGMGGRELFERLREAHFDGPVILMSGHHEEVIDTQGFACTLEKPVAAHVLAAAVYEALGAARQSAAAG
ncbi:MAG: response regulator [Myxococcales bacterium]|nr:response regulator [Myxococcales bacterium]MCB9629804.1 response regulator [Sandaracinaceae bacterium]